MAVMVKESKNGSLEISGTVKVLDDKGKEYVDVGIRFISVVAVNQGANRTAMAPRSHRFESEEIAVYRSLMNENAELRRSIIELWL